ncbi:MAG: hypothetical protein A2Y21_10955 [Clostridiales bacterium GWC2_40_7]|nr:MAG: hypothetical protein A2Y21_10955 [Clostridiales bacterium GWC2_40_7]
MIRIGEILRNKDFMTNLQKNMKAEADRIFCKHDIDHFLDVARIAWILNIEGNLGYRKDLIYAAALLHDIGKWQQYLNSIPHSQSSAVLAKEILRQCGFDENEINQIVEAILYHSQNNAKDDSLRYILFKSDKLSRKCYMCPEFSECKWDNSFKNKEIEV